MGDSRHNMIERIQDRIHKRELSPDLANVEMVRMERVRIVRGSVPREIRKELNAAVKRGELGHMKKDGHKPECYYHPTFEYLAHGERARHEDAAQHALMKIAGFR